MKPSNKKSILNELTDCIWKNKVERMYNAVLNEDFRTITAQDYYTCMQATAGMICIGWHQQSLDRFSSFTVYVPSEGLIGLKHDMKFNEGVPVISQNIRNNDNIIDIPMHIDIARDKTHFNDQFLEDEVGCIDTCIEISEY